MDMHPGIVPSPLARSLVSDDVVEDPDQVVFPNALSRFVFTRTYPRWLEEEKRRETYVEAVDRYVNFLWNEREIPDHILERIRSGILRMDVLPSMRAFWSAGKAAKRDNTMFYNCAFIPLDSLKSFAELMYILMMGTGIGYSVESRFVNNLPVVAPTTDAPPIEYVIPDTSTGWMDALFDGMTYMFKGQRVKYDPSKVRKAGSRLKTKGGRASGPKPLVNLLKFVTETLLAAAGRKLTTVECNDIACFIGEIVMAGGVRRAALISFSDPWDEGMRDAKKFPICLECGHKWSAHLSVDADSRKKDSPNTHLVKEHGMTEAEYLAKYPDAYLGFGSHRFMANNSAVWPERPNRETFYKEWEALRASGSGERGIFQFPPQKRAKRRSDCRCNPCLTGDTLVAVADGRGAVSFRELADADDDVPVYSYDENRNIVVRMMRAPRLTAEKVPVFRVTLDDGTTFRATPDHKFITREGVEKRVDELAPGDRLQVLSRWLAPTKKGGQDYWWVSGGWQGTGMEHRRIAEFLLDRSLSRDEVVHHRDYDGANNNWSNLEPMTKAAHDDLHRQGMMGDRNPMRRAATEWSEEKWAAYRSKMSASTSGERNGRFCGASHNELRDAAERLTRSLGRQATPYEWIEFASANDLPTFFTEWRRKSLGSIAMLLKTAAVELGFETFDADPRVIRNYHKWVAQGYEVDIINRRLVFTKQCERCEGEFTTTRREHGICAGCGSTYPQAFQHLPEHLGRTDQQVRIYNQMKLASGSTPSQDTFSARCRAEGVSPIIAPRNWDRFEQHCGDANHIVVSVEADGEEDVFNGTVDEHHNFFIGGWESETKSGKPKRQFVNTQNCGEIMLRFSESTCPWTGEGGGGQFCNLTAAVMRAEDTKESFAKKVYLAAWIGVIQSTFTNFPVLRPAWKRICEEDHLIGVDITGHCDNPKLSQDPEALLYFNQVAREAAAEAAAYMDIPMPAAVTCGKPSGNSSQMVDCSSGFHTRHSEFYVRRVRIAGTDPLFHLARAAGAPVFRDVKYTDVEKDEDCPTWVVEFPVKSPEGSMLRKHESALEQLQRYLLIMHTWCGERGHNQSTTIHVREHEWDEVGEFVFANFDDITGVSFLPYDGGNYKLAPYEEITEEEYNKRMAAFPEINYEDLTRYEKEDMGTGAVTLACTVEGGCSIGDVPTSELELV